MKKYILSISIIFTSTLIVISCGKRPSYVIPKDKMIDVLYDVQLVQAITDGSMKDFESFESRERLLKSVYDKHSITRTILDSSLMWYSDNMKLYAEINDSVTSKLSKVQTELRDTDFKLRSGGKSPDEVLPSHFYLNENKYLYTFVLDSVKLSRLNISNFQLQFDVRGLNSKSQKIESGVYYTYADTLIQSSIVANKDSHYIIRRPERSDSTLISLRGYIRLRGSDNLTPVLIYHVQYQDTTALSAKKSLALNDARELKAAP